MAVCFGRVGVRLSGSLSLAGSTIMLMSTLYCLVEDSLWVDLRNRLTVWIQESNRWDDSISMGIQNFLDWLHHQHNLILLIILFSSVMHIISSCMLITATFVKHRRLLVPWLVSDMVVISILTALFITITFISFFIDLLIAIVFPIMGGLLLGLWIVLWRNALTYFKQTKYLGR